MILAIDIGNTGISFGFYKKNTIFYHCKISSKPHKSADEYAMTIKTMCSQNEIKTTDVEGAVISSVVPPLSEQIKKAVEDVFSCNPLVIAHGLKTGLNIRIDNHTQLGSDIVANNVAAAAILKKPFAVIDLGTAITVSAVNSIGEMIGVIIMPGVRIAVDALSSSAAQLPNISLGEPKYLIGKNTADSMLSGSIYGTAAMLDGIIDRLKNELKTDDLNVIACGGYADEIIPYCNTKIEVKPNLTLDGLIHLFEINKHRIK